LSAKTCLLTGATSGIGQAAALDLAQRGYTLWLTARDTAKAAKTSEMIVSKVPDAAINWLYGDLSKLDDVRRIADDFLKSGQPLDLLFLNAGICYNKRVLSQDGYEMMLAVNHLAPFILTNLLFERLCAGENETRIVVTASGAYKAVSGINLDNINYEAGFKTFQAYGNSKLANILFTQALAERLQKAAPRKTFTVNCFHPGFVGTGIGTQVWLGKIIMALVRPFVRSTKKGAETGLFLATDPSIAGSNGDYYVDCHRRELLSFAKDSAAAQALWEKSEALVS